MKVTPIPDAEIMPGHHRRTIGAPPGMEATVRPAEMLVADTMMHAGDRTWPSHVYRARVELEPGDLERLAAGEPFWVSFWGQVVPFDVAMADQTPGPR